MLEGALQFYCFYCIGPTFLIPIKTALSFWTSMGEVRENQARDCNGPDPNGPVCQREGLRTVLSVCITVKQTRGGL